ncbi:MAG TPA: M56 family metallopeptidase, partial [Arthrobacter sp.]|nr:M56 family metallopeptidase [Arthrobacter sp.]
MAALEPAELRAVLSHENAHLSQRHHLLLWAFAAWRQALPWLPTTRLAQEAVNSLIEMLADDVALRTESKATLIKAIAIVASGSTGGPRAGNSAGMAATAIPATHPGLALDGLEATGGAASGSARTTVSRVSRLLSPRPQLRAAARGMVLAGCALLLALPTALLIVPGLLG